MIVSSKELLKLARERNFAFPAANFVDQLSASAYIAAAEERKLPLILAFAQQHLPYLSFDEVIEIGKYYAEKAKVPVVLHMDHGMDKELIFKAVDVGFSSVMIDASAKSFDENVSITREIVDYAHARGVVVEAEIGHVGEGSAYADHNSCNNVYTTVEEAVNFTALTGVDSLAVSIGTAHGPYVGTPAIDFERLTEIRNAVDIPLVLHGGSSSGDDNLHRCAISGISKINVYTDFVLAAQRKLEERGATDYISVRQALKDGMSEHLKHCYDLFETDKFLG